MPEPTTKQIAGLETRRAAGRQADSPASAREDLRSAAHVWLVDSSTPPDPGLHDAYRDLLSAEESVRYERFKVSRARHEFLLGRALVRTTLSRYAPVEPAAWVFRANRHGRPELEDPKTGPRFNLSHTRGLLACVVTEQIDAGVDVEVIGRVRRPVELSEHFFAKAESAALRAVKGADRQDLFGAFWTLKEAYIKAKGRGVSLGLGRFAFELPGDGSVTVRFVAELEDRETDWQFALYRPSARHFLALALRRGAAADLSLRSRWVVPLADREEPAALPRVAVTPARRQA